MNGIEEEVEEDEDEDDHKPIPKGDEEIWNAKQRKLEEEKLK